MIVIGNGESRLAIDVGQTTEDKIGCNAIHRDCVVEYLVAVDRRCVVEALESPNCKKSTIYTRHDWRFHFDDYRVDVVPDLPYKGTVRADEPFHWGSGPYAVLLAATLTDVIKLVGFDLWSKDSLVNNVYKGTKNYVKADYRAVDPSYWIHQISKVFVCFPDKYFIVYNVEGWEMPESWKLANVEFKTIDKLLENI